MGSEREVKIADLFREARDLEPADRRAFLNREAGGDEALEATVLSLIDRAEQASRAGFLAAETRPEVTPSPRPGRSASVSASASGKPGRLYDIDLFQGSGPTQAVDLPNFLKARLRLALGVLFVAFGAFFGFDWANGHFAEAASGSIIYPHLLVILASAGGLAVLARSRPISIGTLRAWEVVVVSAIAVFFAQFQRNQFSVGQWKEILAASPQTDILSLTGDSCVLRWFALQLSYGFFLPNTWRRCAGVIAAIGACPLAVLVVVGVEEGTFDQLRPCLVEMGLWMAIGAAVAIYGSFKLTQLRSRTSDARRLGPYTLVRKLGSGGMGEVHLARHALLSRPCAVKLIRSQDEGDRDTLLRFEREAQVTARLMHPHTVRIFDFGIERDGTFYLTMEYLPGLNLHDLVRDHGPLPPGRVIHLLRQVCRALEEAHGLALIHRDIKPGNLIVGRLGGIPDFVKLLDFGLVHSVEPGMTGRPASGVVAGTLGYLSPEQAAGLADVDARSDLYSLGAVGHFLLTGRAPFVGCATSPDPEGVEIPADLAGAIGRCLETAPGDRFATARELEAALAACRSAGDWGESEAAHWWLNHPSADRGDEPDAPGPWPPPWASGSR